MFTSCKKQGFVRLDSLEDYEIIDFDMVKDPPHATKSMDYHSTTKSKEELPHPINYFNSRHYHPAAFVPPPYSQHCGTTTSFQKQPFSVPHKQTHHSGMMLNYCNHQSRQKKAPEYSQQHLTHHSVDSQKQRYWKPESKFLDPYSNVFSENSAAITHHVPYNLTKGQYEYWMSVPGQGESNSNFEAMQAYNHHSQSLQHSAPRSFQVIKIQE